MAENQLDLFTYCIADAPIKQDLDGFEWQMFSLSKRKDMKVGEQTRGDTKLSIFPSPEGRATMIDKDILIYCISQLVQAKKQGLEISPKVRLVAYDLLKTTKRGNNNDAYKRLVQAGLRLRGTTFKFSAVDGDREGARITGLIEEFEVVREKGKMIAIDVTLNHRTVSSIENNNVLTMHEDYFHLGPLDRSVYEVVRKGHGTNKPEWKIGIDKMHERTGSQASEKEFRRMLKERIEENLIPGYDLQLEGRIIKSKPAPNKVLDISKLKSSRKSRAK